MRNVVQRTVKNHSLPYMVPSFLFAHWWEANLCLWSVQTIFIFICLLIVQVIVLCFCHAPTFFLIDVKLIYCFCIFICLLRGNLIYWLCLCRSFFIHVVLCLCQVPTFLLWQVAVAEADLHSFLVCGLPSFLVRGWGLL